MSYHGIMIPIHKGKDSKIYYPNYPRLWADIVFDQRWIRLELDELDECTIRHWFDEASGTRLKAKIYDQGDGVKGFIVIERWDYPTLFPLHQVGISLRQTIQEAYEEDLRQRNNVRVIIVWEYSWLHHIGLRWLYWARRKRAHRVIRNFYYDWIIPRLYSPHSKGKGFLKLLEDPLLKQ